MALLCWASFCGRHSSTRQIGVSPALFADEIADLLEHLNLGHDGVESFIGIFDGSGSHGVGVRRRLLSSLPFEECGKLVVIHRSVGSLTLVSSNGSGDVRPPLSSSLLASVGPGTGPALVMSRAGRISVSLLGEVVADETACMSEGGR